jgi:hypothetical protein
MALQGIYTNANAQISLNRPVQQAGPSRDSILYLLDFNTNNEGPSINHGDTAISKVENGNFVMDVERANRFWTLHLGPGASTEQTTIIEIKFKIVSDSTNRSFGFSWNARLNDQKVWEDFDFMLSTNNTYSIFFTKNDYDDVQISGWQFCSCIRPAGYNILRIERVDKLYKFYINNVLVYQHHLPPMNLMFGGLYVHPHSILYVDYVKLGVLKK